MPRTWHIYSLSDPRTGVVRYIGWTFTVTRRVNAHCASAKRTETHKAHWLRGLLAVGLRPAVSVIESGAGDGWAFAERKWIAHHRSIGSPLTNATDGGEGVPGFSPSPEVRGKMSRAHMGRKQTPESTEKTRRALLGRKQSAEHIAALAVARKGRIPARAVEAAAIANRGRKQSAEHVAKRIAPHIGRPRLSQCRLTDGAVRHIRASRGVISQRDLASRHGVGPTAIHAVQVGRSYRHVK